MDQADHKIVRDFFSLYKIQPFDSSAFLLTNSKEQILVRTHLIDSNDSDTIQEVMNLLDTHISLDQQYIAPILHYELCQDGVRAFYKMDRLTLRQEVQNRSLEKRYFRQEQLWVLLSSLVDSLLYLQEKGVIYGVLSSSKIFLEEQIRLMDPSAYNLAPMNISRLSFHSPQIKQSSNNIDFNISDVYLLGLSLLQAASLISIPKSINKQVQDRMLLQITSRYSNQLIHVLRHMLQETPSSRPTFKDIKEYIQSQIQISGSKQWPAQILNTDTEDEMSSDPIIFTSELEQKIDTLQPSDEPKHDRKISEYEKARGQFLQSPLKQLSNLLPSTNQNSKQSANSETKISRGCKKIDQNSIVEEFRLQVPYTANKNRKVPRAVAIKNRNAEQVKKVESIRYQHTNGTNPSLMNIIQMETQRALQYLQTSQRLK